MSSSRFARGIAALPALLASAALLAGCGAGPGESPAGTRLTVTQDFGAREVRELEAPEVGGQETVMRLLQRNAKVTTRFGGGFVQSIDGIAGGRRAGRPFDWFFYVNGVEAAEGANAMLLHPGDRVWWDRHDWGTAMRIPAVVGSFPEPFVRGMGGRRLPVRIECVDPQSAPCGEVGRRLTDLGVPAAHGGLGRSATEQTLRVLVGPWATVRVDQALVRLERGPGASGVFARPSRDGRQIRTLDARGRTTRTLGAGTGLIVAARDGEHPPVWAVTGTDTAGIAAAARAFTERDLARRFAVAVTGGRAIGLPEAPAG
ncbi:MAG: hypothetical protein QOD55_437 [Solirubrobacteraceae bacterium]|nr:hypothetical protein [Solirubrobacteraceae bacterium]